MSRMAYKIVKEEDSDLYSMSGIKKAFRVKYMPSEWVYPKIGKLFAFKTLNASCFFLFTLSSEVLAKLQLWECEIKNPKQCRKVLNLSAIDKLFLVQQICGKINEFQRFWYKALKCESKLVYPWESTILCDAIKLIRRIA